jgi:hypothetical protein
MKLEFIEITTIDEILYHLATKEIIVFSLIDGAFGYFKQKGNDFYICIQPKYGSATLAKGTRNMLRKTFKKFHDTKFYVLPGLTIDINKSTLFDKIADFFRNKE